jgi:two-component system OmpR family sensor kinase
VNNRFSLRSRLLFAVGTVALVALIVSDVVVYTSLRSYLYRQVDSTLEMSHFGIEAAAFPGGANPGDSDAPNPGGSPPGGTSTNGPALSRLCDSAPGVFIEVRGSSHNVVDGDLCQAFAAGKNYSPKLPAVIGGFAAVVQDHEQVSYFTVASTVAGGPIFRVRASKSHGETLIIADPVGIPSTLSQLLLLELLVTAGALFGAILLGLWLVRVGLRPLRDVVRTAEAISEGDLMHRVPNANGRTEVGHVATALNLMLERIQTTVRELQASENRLRQFVSDASHELRTPIAAVSAYAQLFKQGAAQRGEDLPRVMDGIERETSRMTRLVEDLLLLARFDEFQTLTAEPVELVGLVAEAVETARTVGPWWPVSFHAEEPVEVMGDWGALRQVVDNLLANVRAHTPRGTSARVWVGREGRDAVVEVVDDGPGLSEKDSTAVFERFFRVDPSRSRETGGAGLGLAIVATIVRAHGGRVTAGGRPGGGARFRVVIPALDVLGAELN